MKVLVYKPATWYLLEHEGDYYINVNCELGFASFDISVMLNASEKGHFETQGVEFAENLAGVISEKADFNHVRNIKSVVELAKIHEAIVMHSDSQT